MTISGFVAYVKQAWKNKPDTSTPLSAARLTHLEDGIKGNSDAIDKIAAAVLTQIVNDPNKIASMAALFSVNEAVKKVNSDLAKKHISPTFKTGYSAEGNRGYITISGKTVTLNLGVYSDVGYGAGEVVATIPTEYAPSLAFATGCYIGSALDKIESVGYAYINTAGEILIADSNFTKRKIARLVVTYQIA